MRGLRPRSYRQGALTLMKTLLLTVGALVATLSLVVGVASAAPAAKVSVANTALGRILVDGRGHTLYLFEKDAHGKSACSGACAGFWPPLIAGGKPLAGPGVRSRLLGTTRRPDGRLQVTYNHHPLYTFAKDVRKGDTKGEGLDAFGAEWYAISAGGAKVETDSGSAPGSAYGNGY
jgi:predicted lipoprotein with Yx(FWY)xxD motif